MNAAPFACIQWIAVASWVIGSASAAQPASLPASADARLAHYFENETHQLSSQCLTDVKSLADWKARRGRLRQELFEMLGLSPLPERTDLKPVITGKLEEKEFTVEKLQFQSWPGLYVTGNLYLPKALAKPVPAVLYVCGHAYVITNNVSYGNKTAYQHHGAWFARNGYACLILDTIQLGEIRGLHHGTYREGLWWWNSRGYTPAGVEAWNGLRALDYLQSRPEVDGDRLGVTGRSGGGAYSWWISALDDRIKVAAPVAGITDLQNHVVDGTVEGHCDCMFLVNTYRWDYPEVAALVAPRPLLICNSDKDSIFPLDGVIRLHQKVAHLYQLYGATNHLGLLITEGPHHDTQDLQLPVFRWFNRFLKGEDPLIETAAVPFFTGQQLKVFQTLPADERTSTIHDTFVPLPPSPEPPSDPEVWNTQREQWKTDLRAKVFRGWPQEEPALNGLRRVQEESGAQRLQVFEFDSEHDVRLRLYVRESNPARRPSRARVLVADERLWQGWMTSAAAEFPSGLREEAERLRRGNSAESASAPLPATPEDTVAVCFAPRGLGMDAWQATPQKFVQIRRRFMLLGQTLDGMRVWDIHRALRMLRSIPEFRDRLVVVESSGMEAVNTLYATLDGPPLQGLRLSALPASHRQGPDYLNVLRFLDIPQAVALAAERGPVELSQTAGEDWSYPRAVAARLHWPDGQLTIRP